VIGSSIKRAGDRQSVHFAEQLTAEQVTIRPVGCGTESGIDAFARYIEIECRQSKRASGGVS